MLLLGRLLAAYAVINAVLRPKEPQGRVPVNLSNGVIKWDRPRRRQVLHHTTVVRVRGREVARATARHHGC
jgi:hypothetical protein